MDIVARYPGSSHDSFIFTNSRLCERFENGEFGNGMLLGDGGYALKTYLMTPLRDPSTNSEKLYNESHIKTRNTVERKYGVWKRRFPCLSLGMRLKIETQVAVIVACAVLHNFCVQQKERIPDGDLQLFNEIDSNPASSNDSSSLRAAKIKQTQIINYFGSLES